MLIHSLKNVLKIPISCEIALKSLAVVAPLMVILVAIKFYKLNVAFMPLMDNTVGWNKAGILTIILNTVTAPLTLLLLFISISFFVWYRFVGKRFLWGFPMVLIMAFFSIKLIHIVITRGSLSNLSSGSWLLSTAASQAQLIFVILRTDVTFCIGYWFFSVMIFRFTPKELHVVVARILLCLTLVFLAILSMELVYYLETGIPGSGEVLFYFLGNLSNLWIIIKNEFDGQIVALLSLPIISGVGLSLAIIYSINRFFRLKRVDPNQKIFFINTGWLVWSFVAISLLFPIHVPAHRYARFVNNVLIDIGNDIFDMLILDKNLEANNNAKIFDTANLRLKATSNLRSLNVVLIILESIRAQGTGLYNPRLKNTPFLDKLGKKSLVAEEMYVVIPSTSSAWVSIMQGIYPSTNSVLGFWSRKQAQVNTAKSLPKLLAEHGYSSAFFAPTHLKFQNEAQIISNIGFTYVMIDKDYDAQAFEKPNYMGFEDRVMLKPIFSWLGAQQKANTPFLLTVMTNVGHHDYMTPSTWQQKSFLDTANQQFNRYLNCVAYIDSFLKELFDGFEQLGLLNSTVFFILGDHGESFNEHGVRQHVSSLYEESLNIPMVIYAPTLYPNGGKITGVRQNVDILPTIADMLGYSLEGGAVPGISLLAQSLPDRCIYFSGMFDRESLGMRCGSKKYIYSFQHQPMQVYDLNLDKFEKVDIFQNMSKNELEKIEHDMLRWKTQVDQALISPRSD